MSSKVVHVYTDFGVPLNVFKDAKPFTEPYVPKALLDVAHLQLEAKNKTLFDMSEKCAQVDGLIEALNWIMPKVHQGYHEGELSRCPKATCVAYHQALAAYAKKGL